MMRYLLLLVLVVCVIGVMVPNTFNAFAQPFAGFGDLDCVRYTQACKAKLYGINIKYYVEPIPDWYLSKLMDSLEGDRMYQSQTTPSTHTKMITSSAFSYWSSVYPDLNFRKVSSSSNADITVSWVKDFGTGVAGHTINEWFITVGLGSDAQHETWQPFSVVYVNYVLTHEIGHTLGHGHSDDPSNIMYAIAPEPWFLEPKEKWISETFDEPVLCRILNPCNKNH